MKTSNNNSLPKLHAYSERVIVERIRQRRYKADETPWWSTRS